MTIPIRIGFITLRVPEPRWVEMWSGITAIMWGLYVLIEPQGLGDRAPYAVLNVVASDLQWGLTVSFVGLWQILSSTIPRRMCRILADTMATTVWSFLFLGILADSMSGFPGIVFYLSEALANASSLACVAIALILSRNR